MKSLINKIENKYVYLLYLSILSVFISGFKIYIALFGVSILLGAILIINNKPRIKINKWQIALTVFIIWSIINSIISIVFFHIMIDMSMLLKININLIFLIVVSLLISNSIININKEKFLIIIELIILGNFIQIIYIYLSGGLIGDLLGGWLTKSSDSAYIISTYNIVIGSSNKNIWASKFLLLFIVYLYSSITIYPKEYRKRNIFYGILGVLTVFLILSRTSQLALVVALVFLVFYFIRNINRKYKIGVYLVSAVLVVFCIAILVEKFFHISFDMTDGGFTRLYIWNKLISNIGDTHFIIGNGLGYSKTFISQVVQRQESNLHNVYMNLFFELGIVGILSYILFLVFFVKENIKSNEMIKFIFLIVIPFIITTSLQYLGFDNDLVIMFILILIVAKANESKELNKKNKKINKNRYTGIVTLFAVFILGSVFVSGQKEPVNEVNIESNESIIVKRQLYDFHKEAYKATMTVLDSVNLDDETIQVKINEARQAIKQYKEFYLDVNDDNNVDNDVIPWGVLLDGKQQEILDRIQEKINIYSETKKLDDKEKAINYMPEALPQQWKNYFIEIINSI